MADQLVRGVSEDGWAVDGESKSGVGIRGISETGWAVDGESKSGVGIRGISETGWAVDGESKSGVGIRGISEDGWAVDGESKSGVGIRGISETGWAIDCESTSGIGLRAKGGSLAGLFLGDVEITGDIRLTNADCAEDFDIAGLEKVAPGTVMVIDSEGALCPSEKAYDKRVIILDKQESSNNRMPIALMGKVFCKVDAQYGAIEVGDLLTTSPTPGHAMRVDDPFKALGTIIGKALRPLDNSQGLIPILIALQ
jgi:hypothetical protein